MARPKSSDPTRDFTVSLLESQWQWLCLWSEGNRSNQLRDLLDRAMKFWPDGPSANGAARGAAPRPGGVRDLRRRVRLLEARLREAGIDPEEVTV